MDSLLNTIGANIRGKSSLLELGRGSGDLVNTIAENFGDLERIVAVDYFNKPERLNERVEFIKNNTSQGSRLPYSHCW